MQADSLETFRALVLNAYYEPVRIISWQRAMLLYFGDKIDVLESYDAEVRSVSQSFIIPAVIRLKGYTRPKKITYTVRFCREHVFIRDDHRCQYCYKKFHSRELTLDHVLPIYRGGKTSWTNVVACCQRCNQVKGGRTPLEAGFNLYKQPLIPQKNFLPTVLSYKMEIPSIWRQYFRFGT
jgi:5-methylcytosine-specific restriction endonuclease McrA